MELWTCILVLCAAVVCVTCEQQSTSDEDWLELDTSQGPVRGRKDPLGFYAFYSIPYVTTPLKENKYKPALPAPVWTKPYDAIDKHIRCPQPAFHGEKKPTLMQEDCLIANVFVPDTKKNNLSVVVYVHGGAFIMGHSQMFTAKHFVANRDIIMVTFNYRLGIHGFLCLGTEDIPGNVGMKDQVALLRWVQKNIASYGGNPDDVTIAGYSAGSVSVDLLMLSKSAEGLFHRVIPESGGNLAAFAIQRNPLEIAQTYAKRYNFTEVDDIYALEKFYKTAPIEWITTDTFFGRTDSTFLFAPCIERETEDEAFLTESPLSILQKGSYRKLPVLYGFAEMEGLVCVWSFEDWKYKMNEKFSDFFPADLHFKSEEEREAVAEKVKKFYFGDKLVGNDNILSFIDMFSDIVFTHPMLWAVKLHVEAGHNQVYLYEYSYIDEDTPLVPHTSIRGASHCAQTQAIMDGGKMTHSDENLLTPAYKNMKKVVRDIWYYFIKTGKPVPEQSSLPAWPAAGADRSPYMSLGQKVELRDEPLLEKRVRFWQDIFHKYYLEPIPPPPALPAPVWTKPYEAINKHVICPQPTFHVDILPKHLVMQEDCLIANVFVPDTRKNNLSVLIYVHGGAFIMGYGEMVTAKHLLEKRDIVMVTFNYRLGIQGFLCLGTEDVPGNVGMKDQVALLRWVKKNIASYGGNPDDVTIAGYSAGSAAVDLLMLSKSAEGLFHRVIPESGGNLAAFAIQRNPLEIAKKYAKRYNFTEVDDIYALEKFYKTAPIEWITADTFFERLDSTFLFSPCVERETENEAFLTESPLSILKKGRYKKLPLLYGFADMEGLLRLWSTEDWKLKINEKFSDFLPADLHFKSEEEREAVADKVKKFYFGDKPIEYDNILDYIDMFSDTMFTFPMLWAVKLHVEAGHNQVYLYEYSFVDENTPLVPYTNVRGANHGAQTAAIMDGVNMTHTDESVVTPAYKNMKKIVRGIWYNFIKTGKPVPEQSSLPAWPAAGADGAPYMSLGQTVELRHEPLLEKRARFWQEIYQTYYLEPIPPPVRTPKPRVEL